MSSSSVFFLLLTLSLILLATCQEALSRFKYAVGFLTLQVLANQKAFSDCTELYKNTVNE